MIFKKTFFVTLFLFLNGLFFAQDQKQVDSLLNLYEKQTDIEHKIKTLDRIIDLYIYTDIKIAKSYIDQLRRLAKESDYEHGIMRGDFDLGFYYFTLQEMDSASFYFEKILNATKRLNDDSFLGSTLKNLSILKAHQGNYKEAILLMDSVARYQLANKDYLRYGSALNDNGVHYYELGNYTKAMQLYQKALRIFDTLNIKTYHKADLFRNIGKLHGKRNHNELALKSFFNAIEVYNSLDDHLYEAYTVIDLGNLYSQMNNQEEAIKKYQYSLELSKKYSFPTITVLANGNLGDVYREKGNYNLAISYIKKALEAQRNETSEVNYVTNLNSLGYTYFLKKDLDTALEHLDRAVRLSESMGIAPELENALYYRSLINEEKGLLQNSLDDLKKHQTIKDSLFTLEKEKQIDELQTIYETEKKEAEISLQQEEIKTLNQEVEIGNLRKGLYATGMSAALALLGISIFGYRQRIKKNRIAREKQEAIYQQEIEHKQKELASQTLHLVQKNTFIQELLENLESIKNSPEKFKMEFRRIVMLLRKENASDKDWEVFKTYFSEVHNDFDQKLKTIYSDISEKEIRLAAFLRMNLTTKEIAATLNVLPDSILKSKYRLKKKLGLDKETDLTSFLNTL